MEKVSLIRAKTFDSVLCQGITARKKRIKDGLLPGEIKCGPRSNMWLDIEAHEHAAARAGAWPEDKIKELVKSQLERRKRLLPHAIEA